MQQALRISDNTAFFLLGELIEYDDTADSCSTTPKEKRTEDYITGRFRIMRSKFDAAARACCMMSLTQMGATCAEAICLAATGAAHEHERINRRAGHRTVRSRQTSRSGA